MRNVDKRGTRPYRQHPVLADTAEWDEYGHLYISGPDPEVVRTGTCKPCECLCPVCGQKRTTDVKSWYLGLRKGSPICRPCSNKMRAIRPALADTDFWKENSDLWVDGPDPETITAGSKALCVVRCRDCGKERTIPIKAWTLGEGKPLCNRCSNRRRRESEKDNKAA